MILGAVAGKNGRDSNLAPRNLRNLISLRSYFSEIVTLRNLTLRLNELSCNNSPFSHTSFTCVQPHTQGFCACGEPWVES